MGQSAAQIKDFGCSPACCRSSFLTQEVGEAKFIPPEVAKPGNAFFDEIVSLTPAQEAQLAYKGAFVAAVRPRVENVANAACSAKLCDAKASSSTSLQVGDGSTHSATYAVVQQDRVCLSENHEASGALQQMTPIAFSEFLTGWFELIWPKLAAAASEVIHEKVSQALEDAAHKMPALLNMGAVKYSVQFGNIAPRFDAVHSYKRMATEDEGVEICGDMTWVANTKMNLQVGPLTIGATRMMIKGLGCAVAKPLLPKDPVVGGVQIYFVNAPELQMDLTGLGGAMSVKFVDDLIHSLMQEAFSKMMVLPSRMSVRFANTKIRDWCTFKSPPPMGILRVHLVDAADLIGSDFNLFSARTSDPYCRLNFGSASWQSRSIMKNCNPVWDEPQDTIDFLVFHERQTLHVDVYDEDTVSKDDLLGSSADSSVLDLITQQFSQGYPGIRLKLDTSVALTNQQTLGIPLPADQQVHHSSVRIKLSYLSLSVVDVQQFLKTPYPMVCSVKIYHSRGFTDEEAKAAVVRVRIMQKDKPEGPVMETKKARGIHPKEVFGFGLTQCRKMVALHNLGVSEETLASAWNVPGLDATVMKEVIRIHSTNKHSRFGWDEVLNLLVPGVEGAMAKFEVWVTDRWLTLGMEEGLLLDFAKPMRGREVDADLNVHLWPVLNYPGGQAFVGIEVVFREANLLDDEEAVHRFNLGRLGGEETSAGEKVQRQWTFSHTPSGEAGEDEDLGSDEDDSIPMRQTLSISGRDLTRSLLKSSAHASRPSYVVDADRGIESISIRSSTESISIRSMAVAAVSQDMELLSTELKQALGDNPSAWSDCFE